MAVTAEKKKVVKTQSSRRRGHMPTKRTINLAGMGEKPINPFFAILGIVLILVAAAAFAKFLVIDRLAEVTREEAKVAALQAKVDAGYAELANFDDLNLTYAHYTYSGMTDEELSRADRVETMALIKRVVMGKYQLTRLTITGNQLTLAVKGKTLQDINLLAQNLEKEERVDFCTVTTAERKDKSKQKTATPAEEDVSANVIVFLKRETEVNAK